ncbi:hypothetical protein IAD21_05772 [Abditibacteriota bacterium]|nr:hypothetical protein IAD21_05772 [Abditibacteriota bacterium]
MPLFLGICVLNAWADDARVTKKTIAYVISLKSTAVSPDVGLGVGKTSNIVISANGKHTALLLHTQQAPDRYAVWIDGVTGRNYESVSELQWDIRDQCLFIGKRDGKAYVVTDGKENTTDVADDIIGLVPHPFEANDIFRSTPKRTEKTPAQVATLQTLPPPIFNATKEKTPPSKTPNMDKVASKNPLNLPKDTQNQNEPIDFFDGLDTYLDKERQMDDFLDKYLQFDNKPSPPLYGAKVNGTWMLRGAGKLDEDHHWDNWFGTWPNDMISPASVAYEVGDDDGNVALMRDGKNLGGPRSVWRTDKLDAIFEVGGEVFEPTWSDDGKHLLFCVRNNDKDYLCLDKESISTVDSRPSVRWADDSRHFALWGKGLKTSVFSVGDDGMANLAASGDWTTLEQGTRDDKEQTGVVWSPHSSHYAALHREPDSVFIWRDGKDIGPLLPLKADANEDVRGEANAAMLNRRQFGPLLSWNPDSSHLAVANNGAVRNGLYLDEKMIGKAGAFASVTWTKNGQQPVVIARDDEFAMVIALSKWSLKCGSDSIPFVTSSNEFTAEPLTRVSSPEDGVYRVVMLERSKNDTANIVRYDIKLGR